MSCNPEAALHSAFIFLPLGLSFILFLCTLLLFLHFSSWLSSDDSWAAHSTCFPWGVLDPQWVSLSTCPLSVSLRFPLLELEVYMPYLSFFWYLFSLVYQNSWWPCLPRSPTRNPYVTFTPPEVSLSEDMVIFQSSLGQLDIGISCHSLFHPLPSPQMDQLSSFTWTPSSS